MAEQRKTMCNRDCPDACSIIATVQDNRVVKLAGDPEHPITRGFLCYRTSRFLARQYAPERIMTPLLRRAGRLVPVTWSEALDVAAEHLLRIRAESGPEAIFHYRSGGSLGLLKTLVDHFFTLFGPVTIKRGDICSGAAETAQRADFGVCDSNDVFDLHHARNILLWGKNVVVSSPHTVPILKEAKRRGARLTLIDPIHHETAKLCDAYYQPRPGGDFALAMAVTKALCERNLICPEASERCDHLDELLDLACSRSVAQWSQEADTCVDAAYDLARRLAQEKPTAVLIGWGIGRHTHGAAAVRALDALAAISGGLGLPGGGASFCFWRTRGFNTAQLTAAPSAPRSICEPLFGPEVLAATDPPIRMIWVTCGNPVTMLPQSETVRAAMSSREFVVVVDAFLTDTAQQADLVLPTTTLLEDDDLLGAYGHHWIGVSTPVVEPPATVRTDLEIVQALAARVGLAEPLRGDAQTWKRRLFSKALLDCGVTPETLRQGPIRNPLAPRVLFAGGEFPTPTGRVNLVHRAPPFSGGNEALPLHLLAVSSRNSQSSQAVHPAIDEAKPLSVTVHPKAAGGLMEGDMALLCSKISSLPVKIHLDARQRRDVVITSKGGQLKDGRCVNALVQAQLADAGEGAALYDEPVRLQPF